MLTITIAFQLAIPDSLGLETIGTIGTSGTAGLIAGFNIDLVLTNTYHAHDSQFS